MFQPGDKILHRFNRELGPGEVVEVENERIRIRFPRREEVLEFSLRDHALTPLVLPEGADPEHWHRTFHEDIVERLARAEVDDLQAWENRMASLRLGTLREAAGLGSLLGGRIEIFPHQFHVALQAVAADPVRWLLADEVGLGKTVEACLILSRLARTRRAESILIVAPASLTVQWLGELYRKFHQVFVLLDQERRRDVKKDFGEEFNPFEIHPRAVIALEDLASDNELARRAASANRDLLVVDEAHRLERRPGHPGSPAYRAIAPLCAASRHVLLLSATPLEADAHGFFRLLQLLRPQDYPSWETFQQGLETDCVRGKKPGHLLIEKCEARGPTTNRIRRQVRAPSHQACLKLSQPVPALTKGVEDGVEVGKIVDDSTGIARQCLSEGQETGNAAEVTGFEQRERLRIAIVVVGTRCDAVDSVDDDIRFQHRRLGR